MTSGFNLTPEPLETLLHLLQGKQEGLAARQQRRELVADELRSLDRDLRSLEAQIGILSELVAEHQPRDAEKVTQLRARQPNEDGLAVKALDNMPRVKAIETVLAEAGDGGLHRREVWRAMSQRGFHDDTLADVSAGLAYLKRIGRVVNPTRGYWRIRPVNSLAG